MTLGHAECDQLLEPGCGGCSERAGPSPGVSSPCCHPGQERERRERERMCAIEEGKEGECLERTIDNSVCKEQNLQWKSLHDVCLQGIMVATWKLKIAKLSVENLSL